ncbi:MAG: hypothetical protein IJZ15_06295 [Oscillospiraceae bacterium]|nr:hypothetical protein [Oscillospiraceae bacterium]
MGKKKEKITYIDDGRTLADMSGLSSPRLTRNALKPAPRLKEILATYWNAVKMMFLPMLAVIGALVVLYGVMYLIFSLTA